MSMILLTHWVAAFFLVAMASFALMEAKSSSLIPKSLFLWPLAGLLFGLTALLSGFFQVHQVSGSATVLILGGVMLLASIQAFMSNIRKWSRWPSGAIWLGFVLVGILYQFPGGSTEEPLFTDFYRHVAGFMWAAIGLTKVISEKTISQGTGVPAWIVLLYVQAVLIGSLAEQR